MAFSLFPFLFLLFIVLSAWGVWKTWQAGHKKTTCVLGVVLLGILMGGVRTQVSPDQIRFDYERKSFNRWTAPVNQVIVNEQPFQERMDDKHNQMRDESENLFNRYMEKKTNEKPDN